MAILRLLGVMAIVLVANFATVQPAAGRDFDNVSLAQAATTSFFDGTFNNSDWSLTVFTNGAGGNATATQQLSGGNPGAFFQIVDITPSAPAPNDLGQVFPVFMRAGATHNPSTQGPITSVDYAEDSILLRGGGDGLGAGVALIQNGKVYLGPEHVTPSFMWTHFANAGMGADQFALLLPVSQWFSTAITDPTQHPNFSASGAPIQFGFYRGNSTGFGGGGYTRTGGIDNWSVTVHPASASEQLADLLHAVQGVGPGTSLADKVQSAQSSLASGDVVGTCSILSAFIDEVKAQSGTHIPVLQASQLIADAQRIQAVLAC